MQEFFSAPPWGVRPKMLRSALWLSLVILIALLSGSTACQKGSQALQERPAPPSEQANLNLPNNASIRIATRNAPTTYYIDRDGEAAGFEYELAKNFAHSIGKTASFVVYETVDEIIQALLRDEVAFAAAGLAHTKGRSILFDFGPEYQTVEQLIVCHPSVRVNRLDELISKDLVLTAQSSYEEKFESLKKTIPALTWTSSTDRSTEELMQDVAERKFDCLAVDSNIFEANRHLYDSLRIGFTLSQTQLAWPISPRYPKLHRLMNEWFHSDFQRESIHLLYEKYYHQKRMRII